MSDERLIPKGTYPAKATGQFKYGKTTKGNEQIGVECEITKGEHAGWKRTWYGFFNTTENAERAMKSLRALGWNSDDMEKLDGLGSTEAAIVVDIEEYDGKRSNKIEWVNASGVAIQNEMNAGEKQAFFARMKGLAIASRGSGGGKTPAPAPVKPKPEPAGFGAGEPEIPF